MNGATLPLYIVLWVWSMALIGWIVTEIYRELVRMFAKPRPPLTIERQDDGRVLVICGGVEARVK